jgi:uncharacterized protein (TIGR02246 family)
MRIAAILFTALVVSFVSLTPPVGGQLVDEAAIRKTVEQIYAGFNNHDAKAIADLCDENLDTWEMGKAGRQAVEEWILEMVPNASAGTAKEAGEIGISFITPDVAIQKSRRELTGVVGEEGKAGPPEKQLFLRIFVKKEGRWLLRGFFARPAMDD